MSPFKILFKENDFVLLLSKSNKIYFFTFYIGAISNLDITCKI